MPPLGVRKQRTIASKPATSKSSGSASLPKRKAPPRDRNHTTKSRIQTEDITVSSRNPNLGAPNGKHRGAGSEQTQQSGIAQSTPFEISYADCLLDNNLEHDEEESEQAEQNSILSTNVPNNPAIKMQLRQRFFDLHFGATSHAPPVFVYEVLDINNPKKTALTAAMDTLCIAQLATTFRDEHLAATSRNLYGQAIHRLKEKIRRVSKQRQLQSDQFDEIIGTIHALIPCAWFDCVGTSKSDWMRHTQGLNRIVELYGPQSLSVVARERFYYHWERRAFWSYLAQRKRMPLKRSSTHETTAGQNDDSFFTDCALQIPELLERTDVLLNAKSGKKKNARAVLEILTALGKYAAKIKRWHLHWTSEVPSGSRIINVKSFPTFSSLCKEHINVFPTVYTFAGAVYEREVRLSYVSLLEILQAIIDVHFAYANLCAEAELRPQLQLAKCDAKLAADSLCMHVPWNAQDHKKAFGATCSLMPLYHASEYYRKNGYEDQLGWCEEVLQSLSTKYGISIDFAAGRVNWITNV